MQHNSFFQGLLWRGRAETAAYGWCDGISVSLVGNWLALVVELIDLTLCLAVISNTSTKSLLVLQAASPPAVSQHRQQWSGSADPRVRRSLLPSRKLVRGGTGPKQ